MGFGSQKKGGFNKLTRAYKSDPSTENYVKLRRGYPKTEIEIAVLGGIEPLFFMEPELSRYGIDPDLVAGQWTPTLQQSARYPSSLWKKSSRHESSLNRANRN
jgi:hypothetical protein